MATGTVTATSLNLRSAPNGAIITTLRLGSPLTILRQNVDWLEVSSAVGTGFVSAQFVKLDAVAASAAAQPAVPPRDNGTIRTDNDHAYTPDGSKFAIKHGAGFGTLGATTVSLFVTSAGASLGAIPPSLLRVMQAVSLNEGKLEAINSYDNSFMSFGAFQWTAGADSNAGELAGLIERIKQKDQARFYEYFGSFALDAVITVAGKLPYGFLTLGGKRLQTPADKTSLRDALWAYRFWRAGHDDTVRTCQIEQALSRIDAFYHATITVPVGGTPRSVDKYITSEYGVAIILDEHVNRPGHVPGTLDQAITQYVNAAGRADPAAWSSDDEHRVLETYLQIRAGTSMTDSDSRAKTIAKSGHVSTERGSFLRS